MSSIRFIGVMLLAFKIVGLSVISYWVIALIIVFGYLYEFCKNMLKAGGWVDAMKRESAKMFLDRVQKRATERARRDILKNQ